MYFVTQQVILGSFYTSPAAFLEFATSLRNADSFYQRMEFRNLRFIHWCPCCCYVTDPRPSQGTDLGVVCIHGMYMHTQAHIYLSIYITYVHMHTYILCVYLYIKQISLSLYIKNQPFTVLVLILVQHHKAHCNFFPFHICDSFVQY